MKKTTAALGPEDVSDIIQMALSDHVSFENIEQLYGLKESQVVRLMRANLKAGSYRAWRKRVHDFGTRREFYKWKLWKNLICHLKPVWLVKGLLSGEKNGLKSGTMYCTVQKNAVDQDDIKTFKSG